jgi:Asp-tRNA(Asn)/Glu-tRNA(Gln) amidotransferase A subunit family amidase
MKPATDRRLDRRTFLLGAAAPAAVPSWRGDATARPDDADDMAAFARLAGLEFSEAERKQAQPSLGEFRQGYTAVRNTAIPFALPPCATFDAIPAGVGRPQWTPKAIVAIPNDVPMPATDVDLAFAPLLDLASLLRQRKVTSVRLTQLALDRLAKFDPQLFCVVNLLRDEALARAAAMDAELAAGTDRGPLHGIPYGAKDLFAWPSAPTTFGAAPWRDHVWNATATPLQRLHDAGAVLVAQLSLGALAMGDLWHGGRTRNPYDQEKGSSGSSAGSASAVAAGLVPFALGTETLGSIVSPCRQCGVAGLRPTFGAVSRAGAMPLSWTMDKVGPIARTAVDAALVFDAIRGADGLDPSARDGRFDAKLEVDLQYVRVGVLDLRGFPSRAEDREFLAWLESKVRSVRKVTLPDAPYGGMLAMLHAEAAAAFDAATRQGLLDQLPGQGPGDWPNQFRSARTIPAVEYLQASRARTQLVADMAKALGDIDVLVAPTHGGPTLVATNLTGHPAYVLPVGRSERDGGRPTVLQLVGKPFGETDLLAVAAAWQRQTDWHRTRPALTR